MFWCKNKVNRLHQLRKLQPVKNKTTGSFQRFLADCSALVQRLQQLWKLAIWWKKVLASLLLAAGISLPTIYFWPAKQKFTVRHLSDGSVLVENPAHASPQESPLPDGSRVTLADASYIQYPEQQHGDRREVTLSGQAKFEIAPDKRPFTVHAGNTDIEVLGTQFNVMNYTDGPTIVTLISGKIRLSNANGRIELQPGQRVTIKNGQMAKKDLEHPESCLAWAYNPPYFSFENDSLDTALREIARWYDVKISNPEDLAGDPIVGKLPRTLSLDEILDCIRVSQISALLDIKKIGNTIYVTRHQ